MRGYKHSHYVGTLHSHSPIERQITLPPAFHLPSASPPDYEPESEKKGHTQKGGKRATGTRDTRDSGSESRRGRRRAEEFI